MIDITEHVDDVRLHTETPESESQRHYDYQEDPPEEEVTSDELDILDWDEDSGLRRPDLEPEDWIGGGTPNPNFYPLLQDLPHDDPLRGRAVACAARLARECNQTNPHDSRALEFQQKCQQEAVLYLLTHSGLVTNKILDGEVLREINQDFEQFQPDKSKEKREPRIPKVLDDHLPTASGTLGFYRSLRELDIEWLLEKYTVEQTADKLGISESTIYRVKRELKPRQAEREREAAKRKANPRLPRPEQRLPWSDVAKHITLPKVKPPPDDINPEDWPTPHSRLYAECHIRGTADCELIDRYLNNHQLTTPERDRLRELAHNKLLG